MELTLAEICNKMEKIKEEKRFLLEEKYTEELIKLELHRQHIRENFTPYINLVNSNTTNQYGTGGRITIDNVDYFLFSDGSIFLATDGDKILK
jgi:hypothetical protein